MEDKFFYFYFAGFVCKISGSKKQIDYLIKCYLKSPFSTFIQKNGKSRAEESAQLFIKTSNNRSFNTEFFQLKSDPDNLIFYLYCTENLFFLFLIIEQVLRKIFYILFFKSNGLILHASAVIHNNSAFIFTGPSGSGKSTIVLKLKREEKDVKIICDNNAYIKKIGSKFYIFPPAFLEWNLSSELFIENKYYLIKKFFFLKKNKTTSQKDIDLIPLFSKIFKQVQIPFSCLSDDEIDSSKNLIFTFMSELKNKECVKILNFDLKSPLSNIIF